MFDHMPRPELWTRIALVIGGLAVPAVHAQTTPAADDKLDTVVVVGTRRSDITALQSADNKVAVPPLVGALLKNEQDVSLFEKLVFMNQRNR